ncbi:MAG: indolepyruvate oxidoreductase subunit beta family protein [Rhodospirillaceae bacterium]
MVSHLSQRPLTLMISAIGGEGGGVLANWIVAAARHSNLYVQATSIPGVAQRTGATVYYLEIFPISLDELGGRRPVLGIYPGVGDVDTMIASEFAEAGRAIANGFITPDRTTLITSMHRVYSIGEKSDPTDGRMDDQMVLSAVRKRAARILMDDFKSLAEDSGVSLNAILLGVFAAQCSLIKEESFRVAINNSAVAVEANLRGFEIGLSHRFADEISVDEPKNAMHKRVSKKGDPGLEIRARKMFPKDLAEIVIEGAYRLSAYQSPSYGTLYIDRLEKLFDQETELGGAGAVTFEAARHLAVRMSYEDIIRVAQLKIDPGRMARIRREVGVTPDQPVSVYDYFKPGPREFCDILPLPIGRLLCSLGSDAHWERYFQWGLRLRSTNISGFLLLRFLSAMRVLRPISFGYAECQKSVTQYLADIKKACAISLEFGFEVAACGGLKRGYGNTAQRSAAKERDLRAAIIGPVLEGKISSKLGCDALANARLVAAKDPDGNRLERLLKSIYLVSEA